MKLLNRYIVILWGIIFVSCGDNHALKEKTIYIFDENKAWLSSDTINDNFIVVDNHGISQSFCMNNNEHDFTTSWSSILGINTDMVHLEYFNQSYTASFGSGYTAYLEASFEPFGDLISVDVDEAGFTYDFKWKVISRIRTPYGYKSLSLGENGYEPEDTIFSEIEFLTNFECGQATYDTVLHFTLKDYQNKWSKYTVNEIYYAKGVGLIRYDLVGDIYYERKTK